MLAQLRATHGSTGSVLDLTGSEVGGSLGTGSDQDPGQASQVLFSKLSGKKFFSFVYFCLDVIHN